LTALFVAKTEILIHNLELDTATDIEDAFQKLTFDGICSFVLGRDFNTQKEKISVYKTAWENITNHLSCRFLFHFIPFWKLPFPFRDLIPGLSKFDTSLQLLDSAIYESISKRSKEGNLQDSHDLLSFMLLQRQLEENNHNQEDDLQEEKSHSQKEAS